MVLSLLTACSGDGEGTGTVWQKLRAATDPMAAPANAVWQPLVNMNLSVASAANLPDGTVLMWAADSQTGFGGGTDAYYTVYDPLTGVFTDRKTNGLGANLFCPGTTNLSDGRVMVEGGTSAGSTSIYDPSSTNDIKATLNKTS